MTAQTDKAKEIAEALPLVAKPSLAAALIAALADLMVIVAGRTAKVEMKAGGSYSYDYADLGDLVKMTRPVLAENGIVALTPVHDHGDDLACTVILLHTSGERMDLGPFPFPHGRDAQATGSMVTYHRRYALAAALGLAVGDDDDGAAAKPRQTPVVEGDEAKAVRASLAALPADVSERLITDAIARAGVPGISDVLADDGWRKWLAQAIEHHLKAGES